VVEIAVDTETTNIVDAEIVVENKTETIVMTNRLIHAVAAAVVVDTVLLQDYRKEETDATIIRAKMIRSSRSQINAAGCCYCCCC